VTAGGQTPGTSAAGVIFNVMRFAVHDGPGIRTTVFLKGCPLDCWWCHNPEGQRPEPEMVFWPGRCLACGRCVEVCPTGAAAAVLGGEAGGEAVGDAAACILCGRCAEVCPSEARQICGRVVRAEELLDEIYRDRLFYDQSGGGVTFSGGEPLAQPDFLDALLQGCRGRGVRTCVDTSGWAPTGLLLALAATVDLFLYDLKIMDPELHRRYAGLDNSLVLDNLRALVAAGRRVTVRIPVIPGVNDGAENVAATGEFLSSLGDPPDVVLLPYHRTGEDKHARLGRAYRLSGTMVPGAGRMDQIARQLGGYGLTVQAGG